MSIDGGLGVFAVEQPRLLGLAYRLLGSLADAEDVCQETWLRWSAADTASIERPPAWLRPGPAHLDRVRPRQAAGADGSPPAVASETPPLGDPADPLRRHGMSVLQRRPGFRPGRADGCAGDGDAAGAEVPVGPQPRSHRATVTLATVAAALHGAIGNQTCPCPIVCLQD